jgi:hypothetical protein
MRTTFIALGIGLALTTAACSSSSKAKMPHAAAPAPSTASSTPASSPTAVGSGPGIRLTGAYAGTITATLCTGNSASIAATLNGDSETYRGVISATAFGFVGPDAADYSLAAGQPKPSVTAGGSSFTVTGVTLVDLISGKQITATGTVTCP